MTNFSAPMSIDPPTFTERSWSPVSPKPPSLNWLLEMVPALACIPGSCGAKGTLGGVTGTSGDPSVVRDTIDRSPPTVSPLAWMPSGPKPPSLNWLEEMIPALLGLVDKPEGMRAGSALAPPTGTGWVPPAAGLPIPSSKISTRRAPFGIATFCICRPSVVKPPTFTWLPLIRPEFTADWG